jgi:hypothetical protein
MFFFLSYAFCSTRSENKREERFVPRSWGETGKVAQIMHSDVSKCKNDKIKFKKL